MATIRTNTPLQAGETQTTALPANAANATLILGASNNVAIRRWRRFNTGKTPVLIRKDVTLGLRIVRNGVRRIWINCQTAIIPDSFRDTASKIT